MDYRLSPSDLTFLFDSCKHCFVLKVKNGISQPSIPLPGVFSIIADIQKNYYSGRRTEEFCPQLPPGTVTLGEKQVRSTTIEFDGLASTCYLIYLPSCARPQQTDTLGYQETGCVLVT